MIILSLMRGRCGKDIEAVGRVMGERGGGLCPSHNQCREGGGAWGGFFSGWGEGRGEGQGGVEKYVE